MWAIMTVAKLWPLRCKLLKIHYSKVTAKTHFCTSSYENVSGTNSPFVFGCADRSRVASSQIREGTPCRDETVAGRERLPAGQGEPAHRTRNAENINTIGL